MYRQEHIKWIDSGFSLRADLWQSIDDIKELLKYNKIIDTIGFVVYENDEWVILVQSINCLSSEDDDSFRGGYFIYKPCIKIRECLNGE